jgi:hypothetical protein
VASLFVPARGFGLLGAGERNLVSTKRQTRREAGAQSHGPPLRGGRVAERRLYSIIPITPRVSR